MKQISLKIWHNIVFPITTVLDKYVYYKKICLSWRLFTVFFTFQVILFALSAAGTAAEAAPIADAAASAEAAADAEAAASAEAASDAEASANPFIFNNQQRPDYRYIILPSYHRTYYHDNNYHSHHHHHGGYYTRHYHSSGYGGGYGGGHGGGYGGGWDGDYRRRREAS